MGRTSTARWVRVSGAMLTVFALWVSSIDESPPSPDRIAQLEPRMRASDLRPRVASASVSSLGGPEARWAAEMRPSAPLGETSGLRRAVAPPDPLTIAAGPLANELVAPSFVNAFGLETGREVVLMPCTGRDAIDRVLAGRADVALLAGSLSRREHYAGLAQQSLGVELFAVAVAPDFPLRSLTASQVRQLLSGRLRDWRELGCPRGKVTVIVPREPHLAERAASSLIRGDRFADDALRVDGQRHVADQLLRNSGAIAVVRVPATPPQGMKLLQIDWIEPSVASFGTGAYRYGVPLQIVMKAGERAALARWMAFADSEDGRELLGRTLLPLR